MSITPTLDSVARLVEKGKAKNPQLARRYERAAAIVLNGEWKVTDDPDTYLIHGYHVNGACQCPDFTKGGAPMVNGERYCKHRIARTMLTIVADEQPAPSTAIPDDPDLWRSDERGNPGLQSMAWAAFAQSYKH